MRRRFQVRRFVAFASSACLIGAGAVGLVGASASPAAATTSTTIVGPSAVSVNGPWNLETTSNTGTIGFVNGPGTPPSGIGSLAMSIASGQHEWLNNYTYGACADGSACTTPVADWTNISTIDTLGYSTYRTSGTTYPSLNIEVDPTGTGTGFTTFVFIPTAGLVSNSTWQTWDALNTSQGTWFSTKNLGTAPFNCNFQSAGCSASWAQIQAAYPAGKVILGLGPNIGTGGTFTGNVDDVTVGVSGATTVYDFEPECTTVCYVNAATGNDINTGAANDPLKTVQAGINAVSPGGTVNVAAGTYTEQDTINKAVTITGAGQATTTIQGPASSLLDSSCVPLDTNSQPLRAVVTLCGSPSQNVSISGVTVSGGATGEDADASCFPKITGVFVSDGYTLNLSNSTVTNVYNAGGVAGFGGCQQGVALQAGSSSRGVAGNLVANNVTVNRYQKGGIEVDGVGSSGTIANSLIQGDQLPGLSATTAMNGIEIGDGASGAITGSTISGNECNLVSVCGADPVADTQSGGILLFDDPGTTPVPTVSVSGNIVTGNDIGIYTDQLSGSPTISGNTVNANRDLGVQLDEGTATVTNNQITNNGTAPFGAGVYAIQGFYSLGNTTATVSMNTISGNPTGVVANDVAPADAFTTNITVNRNSITGNSTAGVTNLAAATLDASCNWWGTTNGPGPVGTGSGDHVSTGVTFSPWLISNTLTGPCTGSAVLPPVIGSVLVTSPTSANVSFTPGPDGGNAFTSFTATCVSLDGHPSVSASGPSSAIAVYGLLAGHPYQCTVTETNVVGTSGPSAPSPVIWPGGEAIASCGPVPNAPTMLSTAPGNGSAVVSWAPSTTGCVAGYVVTPFIGGVAQLAKLVPGHGTTTVVPGLINGQAYQFTVTGENGVADGPASVLTGSVVVGSPAAAAVLTVVKVAKGSLRVSFRAPVANGSPITAYTATCKSSNGGVAKAKTAKVGPLTVSGLTAGKSYTCTVRATNKRGTGPASKPSKQTKA